MHSHTVLNLSTQSLKEHNNESKSNESSQNIDKAVEILNPSHSQISIEDTHHQKFLSINMLNSKKNQKVVVVPMRHFHKHKGSEVKLSHIKRGTDLHQNMHISYDSAKQQGNQINQ